MYDIEFELTGYEEHCRDSEGCGSELQNAFALSSLERPLHNDRRMIDALVGQGRFVVFTSQAVYCPLTDGLIGSETLYVSDHDSHEAAVEAAAALGEDSDDYAIGVSGPRPAVVEIPAIFDGDEIPF